jgi:hypothetical protein
MLLTADTFMHLWFPHLSSDMREKLLQLSQTTQQFAISPGKDCDLYLEHSIVDAKVYGIASKENVKKLYAAKIWIVDESRTVKYREIIQETSSTAGILTTPKLTFEKTSFKGKVLFKKEKEVAFGFKKPGDLKSFGKAYEYDFDVTKIRGPVKDLVESNGWKFEQIITDYHPPVGQQKHCPQCGGSSPSGAAFCTNCGQKFA